MLLDLGASNNQEDCLITTYRKIIIPEMTAPSLVQQAQEATHLEKLPCKNGSEATNIDPTSQQSMSTAYSEQSREGPEVPTLTEKSI